MNNIHCKWRSQNPGRDNGPGGGHQWRAPLPGWRAPLWHQQPRGASWLGKLLLHHDGSAALTDVTLEGGTTEPARIALRVVHFGGSKAIFLIGPSYMAYGGGGIILG